MKNDLRNLFHKPQSKEIAGTSFLLYKLGFDQFDDALALGQWLGAGEFSLDKLKAIAASTGPQRTLMLTLIGGCIKIDQKLPEPFESATGEAITTGFLMPDEVAMMPVPMLAEVLMAILEENADFFTRTLPRLTETMIRLGSIGSALLNNLSAPVIDPSASPAIPSPK